MLFQITTKHRRQGFLIIVYIHKTPQYTSQYSRRQVYKTAFNIWSWEQTLSPIGCIATAKKFQNWSQIGSLDIWLPSFSTR